MEPTLTKRKTLATSVEPEQLALKRRKTTLDVQTRTSERKTDDSKPTAITKLERSLHSRLQSDAERKQFLYSCSDLTELYSDIWECSTFINATSANARVRDVATSIKQELNSMDAHRREFEREMENHIRRMKDKAAEFRESVIADPAWHLNGDLSTTSFSHIVDFVRHIDVGDGQEFYEYLCEIMSPVPGTRRSADSGRRRQVFENALWLVNLLAQASTASTTFYFFHGLVMLIARAVRPDSHPSGWDHYTRESINEVGETILDFLRRSRRTSDGLRSSRRYPQYWNFAKARRELWIAWRAIPFHVNRGADERAFYKFNNCWHVQCREVLEFVQTEAYREVHDNVVIAVEDKLPSELTEIIFEYTMKAEECPIDTHICTEIPREDDIYFPAERLKEGMRSHYRCTCSHLGRPTEASRSHVSHG